MAQVTKFYQLATVSKEHPVFGTVHVSTVAESVTSLGLMGVTGLVESGKVKIIAEQSAHDQLVAAGHQEA